MRNDNNNHHHHPGKTNTTITKKQANRTKMKKKKEASQNKYYKLNFLSLTFKGFYSILIYLYPRYYIMICRNEFSVKHLLNSRYRKYYKCYTFYIHLCVSIYMIRDRKNAKI